MADDSNFDSWNKDQLQLHNESGLNLLLTRKSGEPQDFETNNINYLLNEIVCNRHSLQDSELQEVQLRCINSAIYAAPIKSNYDVSGELTVALSNISIDDNSGAIFNTYRREPTMSSKTPSSLIATVNQSRSSTRVERRCRIDDDVRPVLIARDHPEIQRYTLNGRKVIHISTSLSSCAPSTSHDYKGMSIARNRAHIEWIQKKKLEIVRRKRATKILEMRKKIDEEQLARETAERERRKRENFLMWIERKKREDSCKRKAIEKERELEEKLRAFETKTIAVMGCHLRQWSRKREKMQKGNGKNQITLTEAAKQDQEIKIKQHEEERRKRLEESARAFELWCKKSKNRPRPATQGLLPHQRATPSYMNPIPWIMNDTLPEIQNNSSNIQTPNAILAQNEIIKTTILQ